MEFDRVFGMLGNALYPPEPLPPTLDVSGFEGSKLVETKQVNYQGDPAGVRTLFERSVAVIRRHTEAIARGDFPAAYEDTSKSLKSWMSLKRFTAAHSDASSRYGGLPIEFQISSFGIILADEKARKKSTIEQGWPKTTDKGNRRAQLSGFWFRDKERHGCYGSFWITEESGEYKIAKFDFWTM